MALATAEAIRDQILTLVEGITPTSLSGDRFRRYRDEGGADFEEWATKQPAAAFRRVQVRQVGADELPLVSDTLNERVRLRETVRIAYPQNARTGSQNAMDRDDVINQDWLKINYKIGLYGRGNFSSTNDCTPLGAIMEMERGAGVDYLVITADFEYLRLIA
jgi:hypothetical protein